MVFKLIFFIFLTVNLAHGQELKTITPEQFIAENPSPERQAIVHFIVHQFDDKREAGVTQAQLDKLWNNLEARSQLNMTRFQIINQRLYADSFGFFHLYFHTLLQYFEKLLKTHKIKDVDFIVYARDEIPSLNKLENEILNIPAFMMSKDQNSLYEKNKLLLPDAFVMQNQWPILIAKIKQASIINPWDSKFNKIFWRGAATDGAYNTKNFAHLPRLNLVLLAKLYPDLIDAKFTSYPQISNDQDGQNAEAILNILLGENLQRVDETDHLKYKYLISVDGNTCTWRRVPWIMLSSSVLIKQETAKMEWFYSSLKPYIHYIPVNESLTNLFSQLEWMKSHDAESQQISHNASNFVQNNLMPEHIDAHAAIILNEYHKLQKDEKIVATLPPADKIITSWDAVCFFFAHIKQYLSIKLDNLIKD